MIKSFATGKWATGECDRCGFEYPLDKLKKEWNGLMVCIVECYEEKHPQLFPIHISTDRESLKDARPERIEPVELTMGGPGATVKFFNEPRKPLNIAAVLGNVNILVPATDDTLWSWFGLMMPPRLVLPTPDTSLTFSKADLTHLAYGYSGVLV